MDEGFVASSPTPDKADAASVVAVRSVSRSSSPLDVFAVFLRLGLTSFGGPVAHIGYFRCELVERLRWLDEAAFVHIVALCQVLPGPASSQVAVSLGIRRAGLAGGLAAWLGFTSPSALALIAFAYGVDSIGDVRHAAWLHGLMIVAVAVVAQAVWGMARTLCPDRARASVAVGAALLVTAMPSAIGQVSVIVSGGAIGFWLLGPVAPLAPGPLATTPSRRLAVAALVVFAVMLVGLPLAAATGNHLVDLINAFYRSGSLVFGGGHVVLPLLRQAVVPRGWIGDDAFLAGYGAAQAVPGPLFTFAAYLGAAMTPAPNGVVGGLACLAAIYLPSFLLLIGVLPFWDGLRACSGVRAALRGVNAAVVGLLLAALYDPVGTSAIHTPRDFAAALLAFLALVAWRVAPWLVVLASAIGMATLAALGL